MQNFLNALDTSLKTKNWYSVLFISLTLPDICGKIDEPDKGSRQRTENWFNKYLKPTYTSRISPDQEEHTFLTGSDFYALRCAYLHEGSDNISGQRAQAVLDNFKFVQPLTSNVTIHRNQIGTTLQLQVDRFGEEVLQALTRWVDQISADSEKSEKLNELLNIEFLDPLKGFSL